MDSLPAQGPPAPPVKGWRKVLEVTQSVLMLAVPCLPGLCFHLIEKYLQYQVLIDGLNIVFWMGMLWFLTASVSRHFLFSSGRTRGYSIPQLPLPGAARLDPAHHADSRLCTSCTGPPRSNSGLSPLQSGRAGASLIT